MSVNEKMTAIADAIRSKTGGTAALTLDDMASDINALEVATVTVYSGASPDSSVGEDGDIFLVTG